MNKRAILKKLNRRVKKHRWCYCVLIAKIPGKTKEELHELFKNMYWVRDHGYEDGLVILKEKAGIRGKYLLNEFTNICKDNNLVFKIK